MQQIYSRTPTAWVFSCKFAACFLKTPLEDCFESSFLLLFNPQQSGALWSCDFVFFLKLKAKCSGLPLTQVKPQKTSSFQIRLRTFHVIRRNLYRNLSMVCDGAFLLKSHKKRNHFSWLIYWYFKSYDTFQPTKFNFFL